MQPLAKVVGGTKPLAQDEGEDEDEEDDGPNGIIAASWVVSRHITPLENRIDA